MSAIITASSSSRSKNQPVRYTVLTLEAKKTLLELWMQMFWGTISSNYCRVMKKRNTTNVLALSKVLKADQQMSFMTEAKEAVNFFNQLDSYLCSLYVPSPPFDWFTRFPVHVELKKLLGVISSIVKELMAAKSAQLTTNTPMDGQKVLLNFYN